MRKRGGGSRIRGSCRWSRLAIVALLTLVLSVPAAGQTVPFAKNKIQYRDFEWRVLAGEHVDVYHYPEEEVVARLALAYADESFEVLERRFQHHPRARIPLIVYASDQHFEQTNVFPGFIPEGVLGFTEYLKRRVALPFRGDYDQFRQTLRHELVHAFQISKLADVRRLHPRRGRFYPQSVHWWTEGLAEFWSGKQTTEDDMFVRDLVVNGTLPDIQTFSRTYSFFSYPAGGALHAYLAGRFGEEYIVRLYDEHWKFDSFEEALEEVLGVPLDVLSREWHYALEQRFFPQYAERPPLAVGARPIIDRGGANYKPIVRERADGAVELLFMSPRSGYTTLYRTTLEEGEDGVEAVLEGERSAEFESFHAYESRFDVNAGGVVALVARYLERDALVLWSLDEKRLVGRYQWPDLSGVKSPSWSPDGGAVVFEGLSTAGFSDLYVLDFASGERRALTADPYRDADPDWSPVDGTIVFASDRGPHGATGATNLYAVDAAGGAVRALTRGNWHDRTPRWAGKGERIAFSSDRTGFFDLYAMDSEGRGHRVSELTGGAFDPAWLPGDEGLVFAGYADGGFRIYRTGLQDAELPLMALGPPPGAAEPEAAWRWAGPAPEDNRAEATRYDSWEGLSVDFAGGEAVVAPGIGTAQGAQFLASDMLGNHILFLGVSAIQASGLRDLADSFSGSLLYLNLTNQLNYGAALFRMKGRYRDVSLNLYTEETFGGYVLASYPFSKFRRVEVEFTLERSRRRDIEDLFEAGQGGTRRGDPRDLTRDGTLVRNYVSLVKDNTLWLPTGPVDGERWNVSAGFVTCFVCASPSATTGAMVERPAAAENYAVLADYRRYFRTSLYSAYAVRGYVYLSDGAIPGRAVLGGPHQLRGYPRWSLAGSRVYLVNQEWRFPVLHGLSLAFPFGTLRLPGVQGAVFTDLGSSWLEDASGPDGHWGSWGGALRSSLGGALVLRLDAGRRFHFGEPPPVVFGGGEEFDDTFVDFFFGFNF